MILHCDLNNFYASVECMLDPSLKNVPVAVAGSENKRHGVVLAKNELAKSKGIKTGDVIWEAKQKEPSLIIVPPHFDVYSRYSKQVFNIYSKFTPLVEPFGPDECWLDASGLGRIHSSPAALADLIRKTVTEETGLTVSVGVSFNKVFAKIASDLKKPDATTEVTRRNYKQIIWTLPVTDMLYVGRKTAEKLCKLNIKTIGDLANADTAVLKKLLGINGEKLKEAASGNDTEPVREYHLSHVNKSVGHGMTSVRDITTYGDLSAMLYYLSDKVAARMRRYGFFGSGISVSLRSNDLETVSKQGKFPFLTRNSTDIGKLALELSKKIWKESPPLRTVTISVYDLETSDNSHQLSLFDDERDKNDKLDLTLDKIRSKYGADSIARANLIVRDFIYDKTDDEDFLPFKR